MCSKILVGISGGVDSAASCRILIDRGYEVVGCFLKFFEGSDPSGAREVAGKLGIELVEADYVKAFESSVIDYFVSSYISGKTPNPCAYCNREMKIKSLLEVADSLGIEKIATGHYAEMGYDETSGRYFIGNAEDGNKDQSYFLWRLTQDQISRLVTPLFSINKNDVKKIAADLVDPCRKESSEICFIPDDDRISFISSRIKSGLTGPLKQGNFIDSNGKVIGTHKGIYRYTVGQRRGLETALGQRAYVTDINPRTGDITLGYENDTYYDSLRVGELNFVSKPPFEGELTCGVKIRYRAPVVRAKVSVYNGISVVRLLDKAKKSSSGQSAVFYLEGKVAFGGVIL